MKQTDVIPGAKVMYRWAGEQLPTVIIQGSYVDPDAGLMIKTELYPGGMPADRFMKIEEEGYLPVLFETVILDEKEPVMITADLIRQKSKPLTDLVIENIFDTAGYDKVKQAKNKAVKTRTSIEKLEKGLNSEYKAEFDAKKKKLGDYTKTLYEACREVENALQSKLTAIDDAKEAEVKKLAEEKRQKTEAREQKMFELGMTWNGQVFSGFGKSFGKDWLFSLENEHYEKLASEIEGMAIENAIAGENAHEYPVPTSMEVKQSQPYMGSTTSAVTAVAMERRAYPTGVFEMAIPGTDLRIILTKGQVADVDPDAVIVNERVMESAIYVQVVK